MNQPKKPLLPPVLHTLLLGCAVFLGATVPAAFLFLYSERLGRWWPVLAMLYYAAYATVLALILRNREYRFLRAKFGDEWFFETFPKEREKELRKQQKQEAAAKRNGAK